MYQVIFHLKLALSYMKSKKVKNVSDLDKNYCIYLLEEALAEIERISEKS